MRVTERGYLQFRVVTTPHYESIRAIIELYYYTSSAIKGISLGTAKRIYLVR